MESFQKNMMSMQRRLQDSSKTSFAVVTIPTKMAVAESRRLMSELGDQNILVTDVIVNQCVGNAESKLLSIIRRYHQYFDYSFNSLYILYSRCYP